MSQSQDENIEDGAQTSHFWSRLFMIIVLILVIVFIINVRKRYVEVKQNELNQAQTTVQTLIESEKSIMEISAAQYKDTVEYPASGYTQRTITVESYIVLERGHELYIKEKDGPHFTLRGSTNLDESSVGKTFDCKLRRDETGFTSGIITGKCIQK